MLKNGDGSDFAEMFGVLGLMFWIQYLRLSILDLASWKCLSDDGVYMTLYDMTF